MAEIYFKDGDKLERVRLVSQLVSPSRPFVLRAGSSFTVPEYEMGSGRLQVFYDGLLCMEGASGQYTEATSTTICFNDDLPADVEIVVMVF